MGSMGDMWVIYLVSGIVLAISLAAVVGIFVFT